MNTENLIVKMSFNNLRTLTTVGLVTLLTGFFQQVSAVEKELQSSSDQTTREYPLGSLIVRQGNGWAVLARGAEDHWWSSTGKQKSHSKPANFPLSCEGNSFKAPGSTAVQYPLEFAKFVSPQNKVKEGISFAGAVDLNSKVGVLALDYHDLPVKGLLHTPLKVKKSYFFLGDRIVALGSDIHSRGNAKGFVVETTLFQTSSRQSSDVKERSFDAAEPLWLVDEAGTGYYLPEAQGVYASGATKLVEKDDPVHFHSASLRHGVAPKGLSYEYVVCPDGKSYDQKQVESIGSSYEVRQNNKEGQVIKDKRSSKSYAVIYKHLEDPLESVLYLDKPCLFVIDQRSQKHMQIALAKPDTGDAIDAQGEVISMSLMGTWRLAAPVENAKVVHAVGGMSIIQFHCKDNSPIQVELKAARLH